MKKKLLCVTLVLSLFLTGCGISADELAKQVNNGLEAAKDAMVTTAPEETAAPEEPEALSLGKKTTLGNWKVTAKSVGIKSKIRNGKFYVFKPEKGSKFVYVKITVRNNGKKQDTFLPRIGMSDTANMARLYYKDYEYKPTDLLSYKQDLLDTKIDPLKSKTGIIVFELPKKIANKTNKMTLKIGTDNETIVYSLKKK